MHGEIGKLELDRQVGGFLDWKINTKIYGNPPKAKITACANSYWMLEEVEEREFIATFYFDMGDKLVIANQAQVIAELPSKYRLNEIINTQLKMIFNE